MEFKTQKKGCLYYRECKTVGYLLLREKIFSYAGVAWKFSCCVARGFWIKSLIIKVYDEYEEELEYSCDWVWLDFLVVDPLDPLKDNSRQRSCAKRYLIYQM